MGSGLRLLLVAVVTVMYVPLAYGGYQIFVLVLSLNDAFCKERPVSAACDSYERWHGIVLLALTLPAFALFAAGVYWVWLADQRSRPKAPD